MRFDSTFEDKLRERGFGVRCMWQVNGPKDTMIEGMECIAVYHDDFAPRMFIVRTFRGGGWDAFAAVSDENKIDATLDAAVEIIKRQPASATA